MDEPVITVVMATRNRPGQFAEALASVLMQQDVALEAVVVDDGSTDAQREEYAAIGALADARVRHFTLDNSGPGRGQSYVLNYGAARARGTWLAFLDDDDTWIDPQYLAGALRAIEAGGPEIDLHYANQRLFMEGREIDRATWLEDLPSVLAGSMPDDGAQGWTLSPDQILRARGFSQVNTSLVRRSLFAEIGGFDTQIFYECDRDFYLRCIDRARAIRYAPRYVSRHNAPNPALTVNMSTSEPQLVRRISQLRVLDKAIALARRPEIQAYARWHKAYLLRRLATELAEAGQARGAAFYAREALGARFGVKWAAYTAWLGVKALGR